MANEQPDEANSPLNVKDHKIINERDEYFGKLEKWLQEAYAWQSVAAMFPYYLMSGQLLHQTNGQY